MKPIASPVPPSLIQDELARLRPDQILLEDGPRVVASFKGTELPQLMYAIGRMREICFRAVGEGSGESLDVDRFDASYTQIAGFDRETGALIGGYRAGKADEQISRHGLEGLYTHSLFEFSPHFAPTLLPSVELGRSFVAPEYQRSLHGLPMLWRALGTWWGRQQGYGGLMGPVSIDRGYSDESIEMILGFLWARHRLPGAETMVKPRTPFVPRGGPFLVGGNMPDLRTLERHLKATEGRGMPVLLRQYLKLGARVLAFNVDPDFQDCVDALILVEMDRIHPTRRARFAPSYREQQAMF